MPVSHHDSLITSAADRVLVGEVPQKSLSRLLSFLGAAFIASIAYIDPGNFATNIKGGAKFGYTLLWVWSPVT
jgi:manganese transport protein